VNLKFLDDTIGCSNNSNLLIKNCYHNFTTTFLESNMFEICYNYCPYQCEIIEYDIKSFSEDYASIGNISNGFDYYLKM